MLKIKNLSKVIFGETRALPLFFYKLFRQMLLLATKFWRVYLRLDFSHAALCRPNK